MSNKQCGGCVQAALIALGLVVLAMAPHRAAACNLHFFNGRQQNTTFSDVDPTEWDYQLQGADWSGTCATGRRQSPIAIATTQAKPTTMRGASLKFGVAKDIIIINTGHSIQVEWDRLEGSKLRIPARGMWGAKPGATVQLELYQFHMHSTCEHAINSLFCPLELHLVTRVNKTAPDSPARCKSSDPAVQCTAVFGVQYNWANSPVDNRQSFKPLENVLKFTPLGVGAAGANITTKTSLMLDSLLPADRNLLWYNGSLTTPPCTESVSWHVFTSPMRKITSSVLYSLQSMMAKTKETKECFVQGSKEPQPCVITNGGRTNNRGLQPLGKRQVFLAKA